MILEFVGSYTLDEFQKAIEVLVDDLQSNKINSLQDVTMRFKTYSDGTQIVLTNDGDMVEHMTFSFTRHQEVGSLSKYISLATLQETSPDSD